MFEQRHVIDGHHVYREEHTVFPEVNQILPEHKPKQLDSVFSMQEVELHV